MNAEIIDRLLAHPGDAALAAVLDRARSSEDELLDTTRKQRDLLWSIVERTEDVLIKTDEMIEQCMPANSDVFAIRKSIAALRDIIVTIKAHR